MDATGLYQKYPVNRPLSPDEIRDHLPQNVQSSTMPWHGLGLIKMNSTYLEMVDKFYPEKGHGPLCVCIMLSMLCFSTSPPLGFFFGLWQRMQEGEWGLVLAMLFLTLPLLIAFWIFRREARYTHCPIRFNRKTCKVYVFRRDGTVMNEGWNKLYFTLGRHGLTEREVRAHRMSEERQTWQRWNMICNDSHVVLETFALPWNQPRSSPSLLSQWEFVRRYMECPEELDALAEQVDVVMPVADRREGFMHGFMRHFALGGGGMGSVLLSPLFFILALGRWIVMHVARRPKWPQEVEDTCQIDPNDPWQLDAKPRGMRGGIPVWNHATHAPHNGMRPDYVTYGKRLD
jgi:hypothetical protein